MAGGLGRAFSVAIAAQFQALGILGLAWWAGEWLNENHQVSFNWYLLTFPMAVLMIAQTFYVLIRHFMRGESKPRDPGHLLAHQDNPSRSRGKE